MNQTTKTVFITGASRGIGRAIAIRFAAAGYRLALCCRHNSDMLRKLQTLITEQYHTDCLIYTADTGNYSQMASMMNDTIQHFHHIDVLVNNAGISYIGLLTDMSSEDWQNILNTNLTSVFNSCRLTVPGWCIAIQVKSSIFLLYGDAAVLPAKLPTRQPKAASTLLLRLWPRNWRQVIFKSMPLPAVPLILK